MMLASLFCALWAAATPSAMLWIAVFPSVAIAPVDVEVRITIDDRSTEGQPLCIRVARAGSEDVDTPSCWQHSGARYQTRILRGIGPGEWRFWFTLGNKHSQNVARVIVAG